MSAVRNLEPLCAEYGMELVRKRGQRTDLDDCENVINKALGVLVENGVYALSIFLLSCNKKEYGTVVLQELLAMCRDPRVALLKGNAGGEVTKQLHEVRSITENLSTLVLARKLMEEALTFGRYHCKALKKEDAGEGGQA